MKFDAEKFRENLSARLRRQYGKDISQANSHDLFLGWQPVTSTKKSLQSSSIIFPQNF